MKRIIPAFLILALLFAGCNKTTTTTPTATPTPDAPAQFDTTVPTPSPIPVVTPDTVAVPEGGVQILLSDSGITVDGEAISVDSASAVYAANDIIYYEAGHDFTYGEGSAEDEHSADEAAAHTVVHITQAGTYRISGTLSLGQIAIDLGKEAEEDPSAVVNLVLDGADITCTVAPAVIFYNVYECGSTDEPAMLVDTSAAGANVFLADGSLNTVNGSHVARIYKSYTLSDDGSEVIDSKKLHKYDAAFYSKMSMNIHGSGKLDIIADNEGLDTELHLTINGGEINICSGNDGINTNEDGVSVTAINGGKLTIEVTGSTGEGDGIDSNGWLLINGGSVYAYACGFSMDSGIDADNGVYINGGTVVASGNMLDRIQGNQTHATFSFANNQQGATNSYTLKNADGQAVISAAPLNNFSNLVVSDPALLPGTYSFWQNDTQLGGVASAGGFGGFGGNFGGGFGGMQPPEGFDGNFEGGFGNMPAEGFGNFNGEMPDFEGEMPEGFDGDFPMSVYPAPGGGRPQGGFDEGFGMTPPEGFDGNFGGMQPPEGFDAEMPKGFGGDFGGRPDNFGDFYVDTLDTFSGEFVINAGSNSFTSVQILTIE